MAHLPEDELPSQFDVVIDGTGLVQSIVAAALARNGKSVLHIDRNCYYGEQWAGLMQRELTQWLKDHRSAGDDICADTQTTDREDDCISLKTSVPSSVSNICEIIHDQPASDQPPSEQPASEQPASEQPASEQPASEQPPSEQPASEQPASEQPASEQPASEQPPSEQPASEQPASEQPASEQPASEQPASEQPASQLQGSQHATWQSLESLRRRFTYDIIPKVLYCRGALVELLTQSNCSRYIEFKAINKVFTQKNEHIEQVPCSRADVFSSQSVSMLEKRKMMKFLSFCSQFDKHPEQYEEFVSVPFVDYLRGHDLTENLSRYIIHSIAMVDETTPTIQGLNATKVFLNSLGRFGNAPFIYPIFGVGELPQAFCRMCAVFGGVYCLNRHVSQLIVPTNTNKVSSVRCSTGQIIQCLSVVCSASIVHHSLDLGTGLSSKTLSRAILVTDGPIINTQGILTVVTVPPHSIGTDQNTAVKILQLDPSTNTAVPGTYLIHMVCINNDGSTTANRDLEPITRALFNTQGQNDECNRAGPRVLYSLYFNLDVYHIVTDNLDGLPTNLYLTSDPDTTMTYEGAVTEARMIFEKICPGDEFLPRPPDPEDIIYEDAPADQTNEQSQDTNSNEINEENPGNNEADNGAPDIDNPEGINEVEHQTNDENVSTELSN